MLADATRRPVDGRRGPDHAGRARRRLPCPARDARRGARRRGRGRGPPPPRDGVPARHPRARPRRSRPHRPRRRTSTPGSPSSTATGPSTCRSTSPTLEAAVARIRNAGSIFVGRWSPESAGDYASGANHVLPTGGLARACGPLAVETFGKFSQVQRITREGLATLRPDDPHPRRGRGPARPPRRRRGPLRRRRPASTEARPMSPSPFAVTLADRSRLVQLGGDRRGRRRALRHPGRAGPPVRPQHLARAARAARRAARRGPVRDDALGVPAGRLPPPGRGGRRRVRRRDRRARPGRRRGRDPRHVHEGVPARGRGRRRLGPDLPDVPDPRRAARRPRDRRPAPRPRTTAGRWTCRRSARRLASATLVWLCNPNNPTGRAEPDGAIERCSTGIAADAAADGRPAPAVVVDEAYSEFTGAIGDRAPRPATRTSSRSARPRRRTRSPACGSGSRSAPPATIRRDRPVPPAGLDQHGLRDRRHGGAARPGGDARERRARGQRERPRLAAGARGRRLAPAAVGHQLHAARPRHAGARGGGRARADVPRPRARARSGTATRSRTACASPSATPTRTTA